MALNIYGLKESWKMNIKSVAHRTLVLTATIFILTITARPQTNEQHVTITVRPAQTVEERVRDEVREKQLREAAEEKIAAEKSAQIAANNPQVVLAGVKTFFVSSSTSFFSSVQLENALRKRAEFQTWQMALLDGWEKSKIADALIEVNRPLFTYTFTYKITHRSTGVILASGKVTAFDGNIAAPNLASKIIEEIRKARGESKAKN